MKKYLALILAGLFCLALTACKQAPAQDTPEQQIGSTQNWAATISLEVNPSFSLHLDSDGIIQQVDCNNGSAQAVYQSMNITGLEYGDGVPKLLQAIYQGGYLQQSSTIRLTLVIDPQMQLTVDLPQVTDSIVNDFTTHVLDIPFHVQTQVAGQENNDEQITSEHQQILEEDAQGRPVRVLMNDSTEVYYTYHSSGAMQTKKSVQKDSIGNLQTVIETYDIHGNIAKKLAETDSYTETTEYVNGVIDKVYFTRTNGHTSITTYQNNAPISATGTDPNGDSFATTFYPTGEVHTQTLYTHDSTGLEVAVTESFEKNGLILSRVSEGKDGSRGEIYYTYNNDILVSSVSMASNDGGHVVTTTYHSNGQIAETVNHSNYLNRDTITRYDSNGNQTEYIGFNNHDRPVRITYHSDGSYVVHTSNADGSTTVEHWNSSNQCVKSELLP